MPLITAKVGIQNQADGADNVTARLGRQGDIIVSELHGRFYEQAVRGNLFGVGNAALVALTANTITLTATTTPIVGVYNPLGSGVNVVMLQSVLNAGLNNTSSTGPGAFVWAVSTGNNAITTGIVPNSHLIGGPASRVKGLALTALTGLTNNLVVLEAADFPTPTVITTATMPATVATPTGAGIENFDGGLILPPGGVLALLNTVSTITTSVFARLLWEEVPV